MIRAAWAIDNQGLARPFDIANLDRLATELKVDPRIAKHLCNFVSLCHYYAAGFRSMHAIEREMGATRSALARSLESIEQLIGAELFERTKGKGLIRSLRPGRGVGVVEPVLSALDADIVRSGGETAETAVVASLRTRAFVARTTRRLRAKQP